MKSTPIFVFNDKFSTQVDEVPIHGAIVVIDFDGETKIVTKLKNSYVTSSTTIEQFFDMEDHWDYLGKQSELERIEENGKTGWRIYGQNPNYYGNIGERAVDFSMTNGGFTNQGATGDNSFAVGFNSHAIGEFSYCEGYTTSTYVALITGPIGEDRPTDEIPEDSIMYYGVPEGSIVYYGVPEGSIVYYGVPEGSLVYYGVQEGIVRYYTTEELGWSDGITRPVTNGYIEHRRYYE